MSRIVQILKNSNVLWKYAYTFEENLKSKNIALEIQFKSISENIIYDLNKILENYQIVKNL